MPKGMMLFLTSLIFSTIQSLEYLVLLLSSRKSALQEAIGLVAEKPLA